MRRPLNLTGYVSDGLKPKSSQQGYALFIVLMIMIVVALLVVTAIQSYNTEQRISANDADRKLAVSLAEAALRAGENKIIEFDEKNPANFTDDCANGLCYTKNAVVPSTISHITVTGSSSGNAWERTCGNKLCIDTKGLPLDIKVDNVKNKPRYIIEYISTDTTQGSTIYRVTAKAWGKNKNTVVMLQSYVANE